MTGETAKLPIRQLSLDLKTRWDSTFKMLTDFIEMGNVSLPYLCTFHFKLILNHCQWQAVNTFLKSPQCKNLSLLDNDWEVLNDFALLLVVSSQTL
jgi:hypothetical protein